MKEVLMDRTILIPVNKRDALAQIRRDYSNGYITEGEEHHIRWSIHEEEGSRTKEIVSGRGKNTDFAHKIDGKVPFYTHCERIESEASQQVA